MAELRKDILLQGDPNRIWAVVRRFASPAGQEPGAEAPLFQFEDDHVSRSHDAIVDDDARRLSYALSGDAPAEGSLQVQGSAGGYCRLVWTLEGDPLPAGLDERMSIMADAMFSALAAIGGPPPQAPASTHPALPRWSFPGQDKA